MLDRLLDLSLHRRLAVVLTFTALALFGLYALTSLRVDAVPDITPVQVVISVKTGGLDPEQAEKAVTVPIESEMAGLAGATQVRSLSKNGLAQVVVTFADGTDIYWARQQIAERLQGVRESLPDGLSPELSPITTGLGEVVMYVVLPKAGSALARQPEEARLLYLRSVQDLVIRRHLKAAVPGIADVDSQGGFKKEIHVDVDPARLEGKGLSIERLVGALRTIGDNFGGGYIEHEGESIIVRTMGTIDRLETLKDVPVGVDVRGRPIRLRQIAFVREDHAQRQGAATYEGEEAVLGTVLMLNGANSRQVAMAAEQALAEAPLPADVVVQEVYSRRFLVDATLHTVLMNLAEGAALVVVILLLLLGRLRAALLVSLAIPVSMLFAGAGMRWLGVSANLMSLGAIDFGLLVDASVVIIENVMRRLEERGRSLSLEGRVTLVREAAGEVVRPVTAGLLLIMVVYIPVLTLGGIEGKLFRPMAQTVLMALGASLVVALVLMPALACLVLRPPARNRGGSPVFGVIRDRYERMLARCLRRRRLVLAGTALLGVASLASFLRMGGEFMPAMNEGDMTINLTRNNRIALGGSIRMQRRSDRILSRFGEVRHVFSRMGTPESATDPMGVHLSDTFVILEKNHRQWPKGPHGRRRTKGELFEAMKEALEKELPDQEVVETQPIEMRFNEILEGSRADVTLRLYGPNLDVLERLQGRAQEIVEKIPGAAEVELDALTALRRSPVLSARLNYDSVARYGVDLAEVNGLLETAMGGTRVGSFTEGAWRFPIVVRLAEEVRDHPEELSRLPVGLADRGTVPLSTFAEIRQSDEVTTIAHEGGNRYAGIAIFLAGRDIESFVREAKQALAEKLTLPADVRVTWGGQFRQLEQARLRLAVIVPVILLGIFLVLVQNFGSVRQALLVYSSIPFAMTGGVISLAVRGIPFSVSASIGFIALTGIAILNALVLVTFFNQLQREGMGAEEAVRRGALIRLRPVLMTALVASLGFLPMAFNTGIGAEVQRPLATVVIGGIVTATALTLLVLPTLYLWSEGRRRKGAWSWTDRMSSEVQRVMKRRP